MKTTTNTFSIEGRVMTRIKKALPALVLLVVLMVDGTMLARVHAGLVLSFGEATSAPSATPQPIFLQANAPNQLISIFLSPTGVGPELIRGVRLNMSLGDGIGPNAEPVFNGTPQVNTNLALTFQDGVGLGQNYLFDPVVLLTTGSAPYNDGTTIASQYSTVSTTRGIAGDSTINGPVLLAQMSIDTTGIFSGTYLINLNDGLVGSADFIDGSGSPTPFSSIVNNQFSITAVPEPSSLISVTSLVVAFGGSWLVKRSRRRQQKTIS